MQFSSLNPDRARAPSPRVPIASVLLLQVFCFLQSTFLRDTFFVSYARRGLKRQGRLWRGRGSIIPMLFFHRLDRNHGVIDAQDHDICADLLKLLSWTGRMRCLHRVTSWNLLSSTCGEPFRECVTHKQIFAHILHACPLLRVLRANLAPSCELGVLPKLGQLQHLQLTAAHRDGDFSMGDALLRAILQGARKLLELTILILSGFHLRIPNLRILHLGQCYPMDHRFTRGVSVGAHISSGRPQWPRLADDGLVECSLPPLVSRVGARLKIRWLHLNGCRGLTAAAPLEMVVRKRRTEAFSLGGTGISESDQRKKCLFEWNVCRECLAV